MSAITSFRKSIASHVKQHFTIVDNKGKCCYCQQLLSMPANSTSNLKRHLKLKHPTVYMEEYEPVSRSRSSSTDAEFREIFLHESSSLMPASIVDEVSYSAMQDNVAAPSPSYRRPYSASWNHFIKLGRKGKCRHCDRIISTSHGSSSNLTRHLRANHPGVLGMRGAGGRPCSPPADGEIQEISYKESSPLMTSLTSEEVQSRRKKIQKKEPLPDEARDPNQNEKNITDSGSEAAEDLFIRFVASELRQMCSEIRQETKANVMMAVSQGMRKQAALAFKKVPQTSNQNSSVPSHGAGTSNSYYIATRASPISIKEEIDFEPPQNIVYAAYSDASEEIL